MPPNHSIAHEQAIKDTTDHHHLASRPACEFDSDGQQFMDLLAAYRPSGGLARADDLLNIFKSRGGPDVSCLARWLVDRKVIGIEWQGATWLPLFQFNRSDMEPRADLAAVLEELNPVFDAWELAQWFSRPNPSLAGRSPLEELNCNPASIVAAARADRFIIRG